MDKIEKGDTIKIGELVVKVKGFSDVAGTKMISTDYGDFHPDLVKKVKDEKDI